MFLKASTSDPAGVALRTSVCREHVLEIDIARFILHLSKVEYA